MDRPIALPAPAGFLAILLLVAACASSPPTTLDSERIEARFGSYGVEILETEGTRRVTSLFSVHDGRRVTRTLAIVDFADPMPPALVPPHRAVLAGASIGSTFADAGWRVDKPLLAVGELPGRARCSEVYDRMGLPGPVPLAMHRYHFEVTRDGLTLRYATITELHSPAYLTLEALQRLVLPRGVDPAARPVIPALTAIPLCRQRGNAPPRPPPVLTPEPRRAIA